MSMGEASLVDGSEDGTFGAPTTGGLGGLSHALHGTALLYHASYRLFYCCTYGSTFLWSVPSLYHCTCSGALSVPQYLWLGHLCTSVPLVRPSQYLCTSG